MKVEYYKDMTPLDVHSASIGDVLVFDVNKSYEHYLVIGTANDLSRRDPRLLNLDTLIVRFLSAMSLANGCTPARIIPKDQVKILLPEG